MNLQNKKQRLEYFDVLKGLAILVVFYRHSGPHIAIIDYFASFYMPMFFIISGYFYKQQEIGETVKRCVKSLLPAFYISGFLGIFFAWICSFLPGMERFEEAGRYAVGLLIGPVGYYGGTSVHVLWFLGAIFWGRIIFEILHKRLSDVYVLAGSILLLVANKLLIDSSGLPSLLYISHGIMCMVFLCVGHFCNKYQIFDRQVPWLLLLSVFVASYFYMPLVDMNARVFGNFFTDVIMASLLSICMIFFIKKICGLTRYKLINRSVSLFIRIGEHTMLLYSIECILYIGSFYKLCDRISVHLMPGSDIGWSLCHVIPRYIAIFVLAYLFRKVITKCTLNNLNK